MSETTRLSVNINAETAEFLRTAGEREGRSITEIIRRAVGLYKFVVYDEAGAVYIEDANGALSKVMML